MAAAPPATTTGDNATPTTRPGAVDPRFHAAIANLESRHGTYAPGLSEQLLELGIAYQRQGSYLQANGAYKRALHLSRVNHGLHSPEQIPVLFHLIDNLVASGDFLRADQRQDYLYRVQSRHYEPASPEMSAAMLEQAKWQHQAYLLLPDDEDTSHQRLQRIWNLYLGVLDNVSASQGNYSRQMLEPLGGLLETQYLISVHGEENVQGGINLHTGIHPGDSERDQYNVMRSTNYRRGVAVISSLRELLSHTETDGSSLPAEALLQLGDWHWWHRRMDAGKRAYRQAWDELTSLDDCTRLLQQHFSEPVRLPTLGDYHRKIDAPDPISGYVEVSFTITERGRVKDLDTIDTEWVNEENSSASPDRLLRLLRRTLWRPRLEAREPVTAENMVMRYAF